MRFLVLLLTAGLLAPVWAAEETAPPEEDQLSDQVWDARITRVEGEVVVFPAGEEEGSLADADTPIEAGDRIETGPDGRAELALEPDSVMELGTKTSFTVDSLEEEKSVVSLVLGSFVAKLKRLASQERRFSLRLPTAVAAVRGTEFGAEVSEKGETSVAVFDEGKVGLRSLDDAAVEETVLTPKDEVRLPPAGSRPQLKEIDGKRYYRVRRLRKLKKHRTRLTKLRARRAELRKDWRSMRKGRRALRADLRRRARERLRRMPKEKRREMEQRLRRGHWKLQQMKKRGTQRTGPGKRKDAKPQQRKNRRDFRRGRRKRR